MKKTEEYTVKDIEKLQKDLIALIQKSNEIFFDFKYTFDTKNFIYDPDSSPLAWEYFLNYYSFFDKKQKQKELETYYKPLFEDDKKTYSFWIQETSALYKRICGTFSYRETLKQDNKLLLTASKAIAGTSIGLAGDCCFNFNERKLPKLIKAINNKSDATIEIKSIVKNLLFICFTMHNSILNFALMPTNGGMNNKKSGGLGGLDRFDEFLFHLNNYFFDKSKNYLTIGQTDGEKFLTPFLNSIDSFKKYRELFYPELTSKFELCNDLIKSGQKPIDSTERVIEYIELAIRFWEAKAEYYETQTGKVQANIT